MASQELAERCHDQVISRNRPGSRPWIQAGRSPPFAPQCQRDGARQSPSAARIGLGSEWPEGLRAEPGRGGVRPIPRGRSTRGLAERQDPIRTPAAQPRNQPPPPVTRSAPRIIREDERRPTPDPPTALAASDGRPTLRLPTAQLIQISIYWFGINAIWGGLNILLQERVPAWRRLAKAAGPSRSSTSSL